MRYRKLGSSDLEVSEISLGSWLTYAGGVEFDQTRACTDAAFEAGINFFDTANVYGRGAAESAWGEILSGRPATPTSWRPRSGARCPTTPPTAASLRRRSPSRSTPRSRACRPTTSTSTRRTASTPTCRSRRRSRRCQQVVASGKARYLGFSEWTPEQIQAAIDIAGPDLFVSSQPQYSMLWQAPEAEVFPLCAANGISQIVWSPLAQGLLTGKYRPGQAPPRRLARGAQRRWAPSWTACMSDENLEAVDRLRPVAEEAGVTMAELALAWVLRRAELASAIVGASRPEQVHANAAASGIELDADTLAAIDEALGDAPVKEPTLAPNAQAGVKHR